MNSVSLSELGERALAALDDAAFSGTHIWLSGDYTRGCRTARLAFW
ncbi:MAG: hypothetical protein U0271_45160 [Polyangiaceae bacterium]